MPTGEKQAAFDFVRANAGGTEPSPVTYAPSV